MKWLDIQKLRIEPQRKTKEAANRRGFQQKRFMVVTIVTALATAMNETFTGLV
jgi:hypothetical protein